MIWLLTTGCVSQDSQVAISSEAKEISAEPDNEIADKGIPIRIGWQVTWATQGQLAVILKNTSILSEQGFTPQFVGFEYGGPLNEGALSGAVDVLFTADQPALALCSRDPSWGIVGRLMYNRVGTFVPQESSIQSTQDLKGKTIAIPFGAAAHREALESIRLAGIDPVREVVSINMGIKEISTMAMAERWDSIDAAAAWDPIFAELESSHKIRTIADGRVTSVVVMDDEFVKQYPGADQKFMTGLALAYEQYKKDPVKANLDFKRESDLNFSIAALDLAASVEPNLNLDKPVSVTLSDADVSNIQKAADFMYDAKLLKRAIRADLIVRSTAR